MKEQLEEISRLAGGINEQAIKEIERLLKIAELNGIEKGIEIAKKTLV